MAGFVCVLFKWKNNILFSRKMLINNKTANRPSMDSETLENKAKINEKAELTRSK